MFFFKQKTAYEMRISDGSSDVCSSDLLVPRPARRHGPFRPAARPRQLLMGQGRPSRRRRPRARLTPSPNRSETPAMSDKVALITGATGQDGAYLAELLLQKGYPEIGRAHV